MLVFGTEMHVVTLFFVVLELIMFGVQLGYYLNQPTDKPHFWYLILLFLLLVYNITGGLFPDPNIQVLSICIQNIVAYGSGFLMASYFPFYFYRAFNLKSIRFHALYGVLLFLMLPYLVFFCVLYPMTGDLELSTSYGMIVPFIYSIVILYALLNAIRIKVRDRNILPYPYSKWEMVAVYAAVSPWIFMNVFGYFRVAQWIEALVTNLGFLIITVLFITKSIKLARQEQEKLQLLDRGAPNEEIFETNLFKYDFTHREMEIIRLIRYGHSYQEIADKLFIASTTVSKHIHNIHGKADVKNRLNLIRKLEMP